MLFQNRRRRSTTFSFFFWKVYPLLNSLFWIHISFLLKQKILLSIYPYIEEQTTQWPKEKIQKDRQRSTKHTYKTNPTKNRVVNSGTTLDPLQVKLPFSSPINLSFNIKKNCFVYKILVKAWQIYFYPYFYSHVSVVLVY